MDQNTGEKNKEQVFFVMGKRNQWGVYENSAISRA